MKVTVVIPTFKRFDYLERLLNSLVNQTFKDFEVIVVDDCSPDQDSYQKVAKKFENEFKGFTFLVNETNSGANHSRNRGVKLSKGSLIALVDDDDEWFPEKLEKQVCRFEESSDDVGIVYTWAEIVNENKEKIGLNQSSIRGNAKAEIIHQCFISSPSIMLRKEALISSDLFDENLPSCQDWDMWTRVIFNGYKCDVIEEPLVYYYKHNGPTIGTSPRALLGYKKFYKKHFFKLLRYLELRHISRLFRYLVTVKG